MRGVGAGRSAQRGTSGATTGPRGARSAPPNPEADLAGSAPPNPESSSSLTVFSDELILALDEAAGLLVLVYVWHDGAAALALKPRDSVMPQAVPKKGRFFV